MPRFEPVVFSIAGVTLEIRSDQLMTITPHFIPFRSNKEPEYIVSFRKMDRLPECHAEIIHSELTFDVARKENGEIIHYFRDYSHGNRRYAVGLYDWARKSIEVYYVPDGSSYLNESNNSFFHINLEKMMLREHRLIFHACCVKTELGGILFSGYSGIGKSTQGDLWCKYESAKLINGDRPILYRAEKIWTAYGSPYAGSSNCHINASTQIRAIVMLQQADACTIRRLNTLEAFYKVFSQLTVCSWDPECVRLACDLAEQLIMGIPVYELSCTPDYAAVDILKKTLQQEVT